MLKLLNKNTNMIFFLPDERAISLYKSDKKTFEILDGGYVEEEEVREPTIEELVVKTQPLKEPEDLEPKKKEEKPLEEMSNKQLFALSKMYGLKCSKYQTNKTKMIEMIREYEESKRKEN